MMTVLYGESSAGATVVSVETEDEILWFGEWFARGASRASYIDGLVEAAELLFCDPCDYEYWEGADEDEPMPGGLDMIVSRDADSDTWMTSNLYCGQSVEIVDALIVMGIIPADRDHDDRMDRYADIVHAVVDGLRKCDAVRDYIASH